MLRSLTFIAMRQEHDQTAGTTPFRFAGGDKLVDNNLRAIGKVTELTFPDNEFVGIGCGVSVVKSENRFFGKDRIVPLEASLLFLQILQ